MPSEDAAAGEALPVNESAADLQPVSAAVCCRAVAGMVSGHVRPRRPGPKEIAALRDAAAPLPTPRASVRLIALPQVPREVWTATIAEGVRRPAKIRMGLRTFVIEHPKARLLLDPSIGSQVRERVLAPMPGPLRLAVMPPPDILSTVEALHRGGFDPAAFDLAIHTHLHWDHVSGLLDLPSLGSLVHRPEWAWAMSGELAPAAGVRPAMRGRDIDLRDLDGPPILTFPSSHDVFGDGSVILVDLAGHTPGSVGILLHTEQGWVLVAGDAVWHHVQLDHSAQKSSFPGLLVDDDRDGTYRSLLRLVAAAEQVRVVPTHDHDLAARWATRS